MSTYVIDLARTHALSEFAALTRRVIRDAERSLAQSLTTAAGDQRASLIAARQVLGDDGAIVDKRLNAVFAGHLERAMKTMYTDLRPSLNTVSIDSLSLIDDETVNRQIEVDRVAIRMRDADQQSLGRINIMVAQLHGEHDVRERENPFRPYLVARVLHQVAQESAARPAVAALLFERLSDAAVEQLPTYYAAIRAFFESSGIEARLQAVPSRFDFTQRAMARNTGSFLPAGRSHGEPGVAPGPRSGDLRQLLSAMKGGADASLAARLQAAFRRRLPNDSEASPDTSAANGAFPSLHQAAAVDAPVSGVVVARLGDCLRQAAQAIGTDEAGAGPELHACPAGYLLSAVRGQVLGSDSGEVETLIVDLTAALFDWITRDERLAPAMRCRIAQLQMPFAKAALTTPDLLLDASHPARILVNRLGSIAFQLDTDTLPGRRIVAETARIIDGLLRDASDAEDVAGAFAVRLDEFERFLSAMLAGDAKQTIDAVQNALREHRRLAYIASSLRALLAPMPFDSAVTIFIIRAWSRMLAAADGSASRRGEYASLLAGLTWTLHDKATPEEKSMLLRILPGLVKRIRPGLESVGYTESEIQAAMDLLVVAHKKILHGTAPDNAALPSLDALQRRFAGLADVPDETALAGALPQELDTAAFVQSLSAHSPAIALHLYGGKAPAPGDAVSRLQPGVAVATDAAGTHSDATDRGPVRLIWTDAARSMLLFARLDRHASNGNALYSSAAAQRALREGALRVAEAAPLFECAINGVLNAPKAA